MKLIYQISVELQERPGPTYASRINIDDAVAFERIQSLGFDETTKRTGWGRRLKVICDYSDPRLEKVLNILGSLGFSASDRSVLQSDHREKEFSPFISRIYDRADFDEAPLLRLDPVSVNKKIATDLKPENGRFKIKVDRRQNSDLEIGTLDFPPTYLVADSLKAAIETAGLVGIGFEEVVYDRPEVVTKRLWQFAPGIEMPPCLTPRVDATSGDPAVDGVTEFVSWDDGGYSPTELKFERESVTAMGDFDVALTRETVGVAPGFRREIIVSQRFREFLEDRKIRSVGYVPVRLLDTNE